MKSLQKIVQSLSVKDKVDFKKRFEMKSKRQGFIHLFNLLNTKKEVDEPEIRKKFKSGSKFAQDKARLKQALYQFLGNRVTEKNTSANIWLNAARKYILSEKYLEASIVLLDISKEMGHTPPSQLAQSWLELSSALPQKHVCSKFLSISSGYQRIVRNWNGLKEIEFQFKNAVMNRDQTLEERLQLLLNKVNSFESQMEGGVLIKSEVLLLKRKIYTILTDYQKAFRISAEYLDLIKALPISSIAKENREVSELKNLVAICLETENFDDFFRYQNILSSLNFKFPGTKNKAFFYNTFFQLSWAIDYGVKEFFQPVQERMKYLSEIVFFESNPLEGLRAHFNFAKFCILCSKHSLARTSLFWIETYAYNEASFSLVFPFILEMHILISIIEKEEVFLESNRKKLMRWVRKHEPESEYYSVLFQSISLLRADNVPQIGLKTLSANLEKLKSQQEYQRVFAYSIFHDMLSSMANKLSPLDARRESLMISTEELNSWVSLSSNLR